MNNLFDLTGKYALVVGASSGLGRQLAKALARQGTTVAIAARRADMSKTHSITRLSPHYYDNNS